MDGEERIIAKVNRMVNRSGILSVGIQSNGDFTEVIALSISNIKFYKKEYE